MNAPLFDLTSFEKIKNEFWAKLEAGKTIDCPCCNRFAHFNRFKISKSWILATVSLYQHQQKVMDGEYIHHTKFLDGHSRGFYDMARFGLIEAKPKDQGADKKTSGYWRVTPKGIQFLRGEITVPKYVYVFDNEIRAFSDDMVDVNDAFGESFSFYETIAEWG